ncbi:molybdate ABC transporter substrate-binding protein [Shewanella woodyi]|uniref:Molybdenum ABC transporter, periplasmic molybdate-binding protein n=1 Tax=Shewanella woodyi (strain ATCC 51908 / MS32) TaxID=392500 RepID=B1KIK7_SHEWM|nr:molybdate ABC transporter substrate-binding protein [Shewanella woodyi]ACA88503.1 molybdenum ABC transporter, periplasmic molybdate-binding protein [Shewanella woodyi ATCC 51908]
MKKWIAVAVLTLPFMANSTPLELRAAGSLKAAMAEIVSEYQQLESETVNAEFAPSGLLRKRIEEGERVDLFASANMKHPQTLHASDKSGSVVMFARNKLCAIAQPEVDVASDSLLEKMLQDSIKVGISTPKADPAGDYAWALFGRADKVQLGATQKLEHKAIKLTGGANTAVAPKGRNPYGWVMENRRADIFLTYCTNAVLAQKELPTLQIVQIPQALSVGANYGLTILEGANVNSTEFAMFILSQPGQNILAKYGFDAPLR